MANAVAKVGKALRMGGLAGRLYSWSSEI